MGRFIFPTQPGSVLHLITNFEADSSLRSKVIMGSQSLEIRSRYPGHAHLGVIYDPFAGSVCPLCLYQI